ncbi:hypothetical protein CHLNCDRAFT_6736, partial [Chlorella variabilis]
RARERLPTEIFLDSEDISRVVAAEIAALIRSRQAEGRRCVLGLATGSTPMHVYPCAAAVRCYRYCTATVLLVYRREEGLSFRNVLTFNLDEYHPMQPQALQAVSYHRFMREHLLDHVDLPPGAAHIPDGTVPLAEVPKHCQEYERQIEEAGGIDLQAPAILGLGRTGHIGFNERGSARGSTTRLITLDRVTRVDAASDFFGEGAVPRRAITMGVATILKAGRDPAPLAELFARRMVLMAFGENKAGVVRQAVEGPVSEQVAASYLQEHPDAAAYVDYAAAAGTLWSRRLTRVQCPWVLGPIAWDATQVKKAACWLAQQVGKPVLKLTDDDYSEHSLQAGSYDINLRVFYALQGTISGWPGGWASQRAAGAAAEPAAFPKRVLIMSPHPDDDVISMGGTLIRLVDQGHEVHVGYQTSGNIAVWDEDALRFADFAVQVRRPSQAWHLPFPTYLSFLPPPSPPPQVDSEEVLRTKALIRKCEARSAGRTCGADVANLHFLDMPFYQTGQVVKAPLSQADIDLLVALFDRIRRAGRPHQIFAAGDLSDPHGTHRTCLQARAAQQGICGDWYHECGTEVLLYRGAWQEWEPWEVDLAVPLSPAELQQKVDAIFKHQSQKDRALFPGADPREFWQRAQERNRATAALYDRLGLAEYEAMEAFVRY